MTRLAVLSVVALALAGCISAPGGEMTPESADTTEKRDCMEQARDYVQENMTTIANEWRTHEQYKQYQKCLWEKQQAQQSQ